MDVESGVGAHLDGLVLQFLKVPDVLGVTSLLDVLLHRGQLPRGAQNFIRRVQEVRLRDPYSSLHRRDEILSVPDPRSQFPLLQSGGLPPQPDLPPDRLEYGLGLLVPHVSPSVFTSSRIRVGSPGGRVPCIHNPVDAGCSKPTWCDGAYRVAAGCDPAAPDPRRPKNRGKNRTHPHRPRRSLAGVNMPEATGAEGQLWCNVGDGNP
ncbi:hypothetical protein GCM10010521_16460 [Streptomyces rameus]|uniref:Uncharacterized protein n=1 Tax=Streptomyces rameus TaxID=68261 RepID=A0ABP6MZ56_9ACTN